MRLPDRLTALLRAGPGALEPFTISLALRLTLLDLLLNPIGTWHVRPAILLLAGAGLLSPRILRSPLTWLALALLTGWRVFADWPLADNHAYLLSYWCLAVFLCLIAREPRRVLVGNARRLIGLAFLFTVLWKGVLAPEYTSGAFFRLTLLTDERFAEPAMLFGGLDEEALAMNRAYLTSDRSDLDLVEPPRLVEPPSFRRFAAAATWWTLVIEILVALAFLAPYGSLLWRGRHLALLAFCVTTYAFAPVPGFAWLLLAMGVAACSPRRRSIPILYVGVFFLVLLYTQTPWLRLLLS